MTDEFRKPIRNFADLEVYQNAHKAMLTVINKVYGNRYLHGLLDNLIDAYDKVSKQSYKLMIVWQDFKINELRNSRAALRKPLDDTRIEEHGTNTIKGM